MKLDFILLTVTFLEASNFLKTVETAKTTPSASAHPENWLGIGCLSELEFVYSQTNALA